VEKGDFSNKIFCYKGVVSSTGNSKKKNATYIVFNENKIPVQITISVWSNLGKLKENIEAGDTVGVKGEIYQDEKTKKIHITPLSIDDVEVAKNAPICSASPTPSRLSNYMDKTVSVELSGIEARKFKSKSGKSHLSLKFRSGHHLFKGIMWDGNWDKSDIKKVESKKPLCITAKVGTYKGEISLDVKKISNMKGR
jgi:hypothetical protein